MRIMMFTIPAFHSFGKIVLQYNIVSYEFMMMTADNIANVRWWNASFITQLTHK